MVKRNEKSLLRRELQDLRAARGPGQQECKAQLVLQTLMFTDRPHRGHVVPALIRAGASPDWTASRGFSRETRPLIISALSKIQPSMVIALVRAGANVNLANNHQFSDYLAVLALRVGQANPNARLGDDATASGDLTWSAQSLK